MGIGSPRASALAWLCDLGESPPPTRKDWAALCVSQVRGWLIVLAAVHF